MAHTRSTRFSAKSWCFRLLAIGVGMVPFAVAEGLLRTTDYGLVSEAIDPFVGFDEIRPLFVRDERGEQFEIDRARHAYFRPDSFAANKSENEFRIFCVGGSTVQGRPYAIETSFTSWLEISLRSADPTRAWQVVNVGGVSYASYRLAPIVDELLEYEPDLLIVYTGHNEFLEDRTYRAVKKTSRVMARLHYWCTRFRLYNFCRSLWLGLGDDKLPASVAESVLPGEVEARLDYAGGLDDYQRDDAWIRDATSHYRFNVTRMVRQARQANVPIVLVTPILNLRDCPPFKSEHREDISQDERDRFAALWAEARNCEDVRLRARILERAIAIDDRMAAAHFSLAKCYDAIGRRREALAEYIRAKDEDICPLRMVEPQYQALTELAAETGAPLVDARAYFEGRSRVGIPGDDWLLDHVHPSINGHQAIAQLLVGQMVEMQLVHPRDDWEGELPGRYAEHLDALGDAYFVHGQQRLRGLIRWTKGQVERQRSDQTEGRGASAEAPAAE